MPKGAFSIQDAKGQDENSVCDNWEENRLVSYLQALATGGHTMLIMQVLVVAFLHWLMGSDEKDL